MTVIPLFNNASAQARCIALLLAGTVRVPLIRETEIAAIITKWFLNYPAGIAYLPALLLLRLSYSIIQTAYTRLPSFYPFLKYQPVSVKPSVWSWLGNYMGFTGYYNVFTGEAQVNTLVPKFLQPFTTCHEVAHQLGYAKEMEANFVAYLAATASQDTLLHYSVYLDMFMYSNRNLFMSDSVAAKEFIEILIPAVKDDLKEWRTFNKKHRNPIEPVFRWVYGKYLEGNQQPQGVFSYDEVTGFIIAYYKKYGRI